MAPFRRKIANIDTFPCRALNERPYTLKETVFFYRWKLPYQESGLVRNDPEFGCGNLHRIPGSYRHPFVEAVINRPQKCVDFQSNSRYMAPFRRKIANIDTFPCRALNERPYTLKETVFFYRWKLPYQESGLARNDPEFDSAKRHPILYLISHFSFLIPV